MQYQIESIDLFVRKIGAPRMDFSIGKGQSLFPEWMRANVEVRLKLIADDGRAAVGFAADWPSFGWLDKRPEIAPKKKLVELLELVQFAKEAFLAEPRFESVFDCWLNALDRLLNFEQAGSAVPLCASFAIALMERALIDAFCRLQEKSFFAAVQQNLLGLKPEKIHAELNGVSPVDFLPRQPVPKMDIRHTVGPTDPLLDSELTAENRIGDGEPETLENYVSRDGIFCFKVKICGDPVADVERLSRVWEVIRNCEPKITLDGNEAYDDIDALGDLILRLQKKLPEFFRHVLFIEQPMSRAKTLDASCANDIQAISKTVPLIIDEADDHLDAFKKALQIGYTGVSHKNCKGIFKSLCNFLLSQVHQESASKPFLSAEDLTVMPVVSLQQDLAVAAALGLDNVERNGHHFFPGLAHLTAEERSSALQQYPNLYTSRGDNVFLNIQDGRIDISDLQCCGLGVNNAPDFSAMASLNEWIRQLGASSTIP